MADIKMPYVTKVQTEELTEEQLRNRMKWIQGERSTSQLARDIGCSTAYVVDFYAGNRGPGPKILNFLGFEKQISYKRKWRKEDE